MLAEPIIPGVIFFATVILSFLVYERLVKRQYEVARDAWEADGRPPGFAWAPSGTSVMRSWTRGRAYFRWLADTPPWIKQDGRAKELQKRLRMLWLIAGVAWVWLVIIMIMRPAET